ALRDRAGQSRQCRHGADGEDRQDHQCRSPQPGHRAGGAAAQGPDGAGAVAGPCAPAGSRRVTNIRLLPVVVVAITALLVLKTLGLVTNGGYVLAGTSMAR